jgi:hypothetical protein
MFKVLYRITKVCFVLVVFASAAITMLSYVQPQLLVRAGITPYLQATKRYIRQELYERRILVEGLQSLDQQKVEESLAAYTTNIPFWFQQSSIVESLKQHPLVADAAVTTCDGGFLSRCFRISITERIPQFIHMKGDQAVLLAHDGVSIAVIPAAELAASLEMMLAPDAPRPKIIAGMITDDASPDQVRARFEYIKERFALLEKITGFQFSRLELLPDGELLAKPSRATFVVQFDTSWGDPKAFEDEVMRLKLILPEIREKLHEVQKIDLAYNKLAVVSFSTPQITPTPKALKK